MGTSFEEDRRDRRRARSFGSRSGRESVSLFVAFAVSCLLVPPLSAAGAQRGERSFERTFTVNGPTVLDAVTSSGRVDVRVGNGQTVTIRGTIKRNVSWRGARVTDEAIARLRAAPPVRADGATIRIERIPDDTLWRGVAIDFEIVVPATSKLVVETGSGAIRVDAAAGEADLRTSSGSVRVAGSMTSLSVRTQSGSIAAGLDSVGAVDASSGSGSVDVSGIRGSVRAETGSGRIALAGSPTGPWTVRSRSGSVSIRVPADSRFDLSARSRSGSITSGLDVATRSASSKHAVEGLVNGGGPKLDVETGSSSITLRP